ncbi:hypothetical protein RV02_GL003431 [Enterococcus gilvus]|nr:hypothetical protein RV02_GL003431 [Enterococcus gilvus]
MPPTKVNELRFESRAAAPQTKQLIYSFEVLILAFAIDRKDLSVLLSITKKSEEKTIRILIVFSSLLF